MLVIRFYYKQFHFLLIIQFQFIVNRERNYVLKIFHFFCSQNDHAWFQNESMIVTTIIKGLIIQETKSVSLRLYVYIFIYVYEDKVGFLNPGFEPLISHLEHPQVLSIRPPRWYMSLVPHKNITVYRGPYRIDISLYKNYSCIYKYIYEYINA